MGWRPGTAASHEGYRQIDDGYRADRSARLPELDALTAGHDVDDELARMKAQLPASAAPPAVEGPGTASADPPAPPPGQQASS
jgi:hypothetical protein